jgi:hypothetical protein
MDKLRLKTAELEKNSSIDSLAFKAAFYAWIDSKSQFGFSLIPSFAFLSLIAEKLSGVEELLPFIKVAMEELTRACCERESEMNDIGYALQLYQQTVLSCEGMKETMSSHSFTVAIALVCCSNIPDYFTVVNAMSNLSDEERLSLKSDAMCREQAAAVGCMKVCCAVQEVLSK